MPKTKALWLAIGVTLLSTFVALVSFSNPFEIPHLSDQSCSTCHLSGDNTTPDNAQLLTDAQEVLCITCHAQAMQASHPSGIIPSFPLPPEYPADWKGHLTCSTCHLIHGKDYGLMRTDARGQEFCFSCHPPDFFDNMVDGGQSIVISGHITQESTLGEMGLDAFSIHCMGCHAELGDDLQVNVDPNGILHHSDGRMNHPVGTIYTEAAGFGSLRQESALPEVIKLPDGKVSCVSCHVAYTENHGNLVMSNQNSNLCLTCHDL